MSNDGASTTGTTDLQFDRIAAGPADAPAVPGKLAVQCSACRASIETEYYQFNNRIVCRRCRGLVQSLAETPTGLLPLVRAGVFGLGAGIAGAAIYYAVIAIAHLEIGIVAILIGYMVGTAVRKGARGRGGLRFQVLAVALTYASVAIAYSPMAWQAIGARQAARAAAASSPSTSRASAAVTVSDPAQTRAAPTPWQFAVAVIMLMAFTAALPVLVIVGSLPLGIISALIIYFGMRQAWRMTGAVTINVMGPYRVGAAPTATPA